MPGVFGYYDPERRLPTTTLDTMLSALGCDEGCVWALEREPWGGFGIVNYPGEGLVVGHPSGVRYAVFGHLDACSGVGGGQEAHTALAEHRLATPGGSCAVDQMRGSFVAIVHNHADATLCLVTDRFASQALYVFVQESLWIFASQLKAILAVLPVAACIDRTSVSTMLSIGEVVGDRTLIEGITTLPAATIITLSQAGAHTRRYWQYVYEVDPRSDWRAAVERTGTALQRAVTRGVRQGTTPAVPLSGGLDSRFALELACHAGSQPKAYTWGTSGCRDILYAQDVAKRLACPHETFLFAEGYLALLADRGVWLTEGHTPATNFHVLPYVDELAARGHDVLLDGFAGDGVLGGNFISDAWLNSTNSEAAANALWQWRRQGFDGAWQHPSLSDLLDQAMMVFNQTYRSYPGHTPMDMAMAFLLDNRVRRITTCGTEIFRSRMQVSQPFMDADFIDAIRTLPHAWRKRHRFYLAVLQRFAPVSAAAPYQRTMLPATAPYWLNWLSMAAQRGYGVFASQLGLPELFKGKSPSDFPCWFRGVLRPYVESVLLTERTLDRGVLPADAVKSMVNLHMLGQRNFAAMIGAMLSLELFCRLFMDDLQGSIRRYSRTPMHRPSGNGT